MVTRRDRAAVLTVGENLLLAGAITPDTPAAHAVDMVAAGLRKSFPCDYAVPGVDWESLVALIDHSLPEITSSL